MTKTDEMREMRVRLDALDGAANKIRGALWAMAALAAMIATFSTLLGVVRLID